MWQVIFDVIGAIMEFIGFINDREVPNENNE